MLIYKILNVFFIIDKVIFYLNPICHVIYLTLYHTCMWLFIKHKSTQINRTRIRFEKMYPIICVRWGRMNSNWVHRGFEIIYISVIYYFRYELILDLHSEEGIMFTFDYHLELQDRYPIFTLFSSPAT